MEFEKILFQHYEYINKIIYKKTRQYDLDYDAALNFVLDKIISNDYKIIKSFRGESSFLTYLTVVVNRLVISFARKQKKCPKMPAIVAETPLDILIQKQQDECRERFIKKLPELIDELGFNEKLVLKMKFFKSLKTSQISRALKISRYETHKCENALLDFFRKKIREICKK